MRPGLGPSGVPARVMLNYGPGRRREDAMLKLKPSCECCNRGIAPDSPDARICSFGCTLCAACAEGVLGGGCPNCGGQLVRRPVRPAEKIAKNPASTERVYKPQGRAAAG